MNLYLNPFCFSVDIFISYQERFVAIYINELLLLEFELLLKWSKLILEIIVFSETGMLLAIVFNTFINKSLGYLHKFAG